MGNLTTKHSLPQLKAFPVPGYIAFRYVKRVQGQWVPCNHRDVRLAVVEFNGRG